MIGWFSILIGGLLAIGIWTSAKIDATATLHDGNRVSVALKGMMAPFAEAFAEGALSDTSIAALQQGIAGTAGPLGVVETKVWNIDGQVVFASGGEGGGRPFQVGDFLPGVLAGHGLTATAMPDRTAVGDAADPFAAGLDHQIYVPIHGPKGGAVIAVAGFRRDAGFLRKAVAVTHWQTWAIVVIGCLALVAGLCHAMVKGERLIASQHVELGRRETDRNTPLVPDNASHANARHTSAQTAEITETLLRRIGADLHDGVGQLLTVALLRLDQLFPENPRDQARQPVHDILREAITEVREMSAGLSLPHIGDLPIAEAIATMVRRHERRTATTARLTVAADLAEPGPAIKIAICRFIQEGLGNAFRHAQGRGQSVEVGWAGPMILVTVLDAGPGLPEPDAPVRWPIRGGTLGLVGLKNRVETVGGAFAISSRQGNRSGTTLRATFPLI